MECDFFEDKCIVTDSTLKGTLVQKGFGESKNNKLILDIFETIYLLENKKIIPVSKKKPLTQKKLFELGEKNEKNFYSKYAVYQDLREKGYCIKTGLKFGFDFRVYPQGKKVGEAHSQFAIHISPEREKLSMPMLSRMTRLAGNIHLKAIIAVVDREDEINYYGLERQMFQ
jgi:tRNA-intron endonuclease